MLHLYFPDEVVIAARMSNSYNDFTAVYLFDFHKYIYSITYLKIQCVTFDEIQHSIFRDDTYMMKHICSG